MKRIEHRKRKLLACFLCAALVAATPVPARAWTRVRATYTVGNKYTINIPMLNLNPNDVTSKSISATEMNIWHENVLQVKIGGADLNQQNELRLTDSSSGKSVYFKIYLGESELDGNRVVAKFQGDRNNPVYGGTLKFQPASGSNPPPGTYEGTLTFTCEIVPKT